MKTQPDRRRFIKNSSVAGCAILISGKLMAFSFPQEEVPYPKKLNYCGYTCPKDCKFLEASLKNDSSLKKEAYEEWKIKDRYGVDFAADKIFCFGCKTADKPEGVVLTNCTVRSCAIENKFDSCIQCKTLKSCEKDLWTRFPEFHKSVIKMQESYLEGKA
ncbi:DUF3795 domain-containing protein [Maribellus mangrovi]|uniref:DUF3795 domain-containing protein n=1 Tax=Maribellus mangrovi TaxID=3133146 RepID=UPI0030EF41D5